MLGADAALRKPFDASELIAMICRVLDRASGTDADQHRLQASRPTLVKGESEPGRLIKVYSASASPPPARTVN